MDLLCFCSVLCLLCFVHVCLYVLCGHLLGKGWPLGSRLWCLLWVCHFPIGILGQVWYLIVSIPDLCTITYFYSPEVWWHVSLERHRDKRNLYLYQPRLYRSCRCCQLLLFPVYSCHRLQYQNILLFIHCTVLPAKSDSDVMFCLHSFQGIRIDRSLAC